jgi:cytochrome c
MKNSLPQRVSLILALCLLVLMAQPVRAQTKKTPAKPAVTSASAAAPSLNRILVFSKTKGFRHSSIPAGKRMLMQLGQENGFAVDTTEDAAKFTEANLKRYSAVVWLSTTGDVLNEVQQADFERYIQAGGGYAGIHAAADTEYDWPWYNQLVGAYFLSHPKQQNVDIKVADKNHPSTSMLPDVWKRFDELYNYKSFAKGIKVLATLDESTYTGGENGANHPFIWYREFDGGKSFYTGGGHTDESYSEPLFVQHLLGGLKSVMATSLKYSQVKTQPFPEENRFEKKVLTAGLDEPTELVVFPNGKVLFAERKGALKLWNPKTKAVKVVAQMPVYTKFEYGLMGLNADPKFAENKWLYMFYAPVSGDTAQHLSRFKYDDVKDELVAGSEQVLLTVPVKRTDCCHTGGSIAWDRAGNLYLSTGDDTNPFKSDGYAPIDERANRSGWDARLTSGNTNDLRGKILRIKPDPTQARYDIPEGNLFAKGTEKARPEIYVMGNRNPYRIAVDQRTGFLYWGEVGPDAGENRAQRGPRGHDEINQARQAGNFGWPLFVGDNKAYFGFNFTDSTSTGVAFDATKPLNNSPHNTGLQNLPPAQKAFIYYPYAESPEFGEIVGKGGRNGMGGPVYYYDDYPESAVKFPRHYDGKFFAYDWMRDWINPVTMAANGDFVKMERFMPSTKFSHTIDMQFAVDGSLYVLEYGQNWFAANEDARLSQITYTAGNRRPVVVATGNQLVGGAPLTVKFNTSGTIDYDGDALKYDWTFAPGRGTAGAAKSTVANPSFTFTKPGVYRPVVRVTDVAGNVSTKELTVQVGNAAPAIEIAMTGNKSFYFPNKPLAYQVKVADKEDGSLANGKISADEVTMTINYLEGFDKTVLAQGHQANTGFSTGKRLIELSDCKACHGINQKSIGPAYLDVAKKYKGAWMIEGKLSDKIIKGGGGVWGEQVMSAHPQITKAEATDMVKYILSLADDKSKDRQPLAGQYTPAKQSKDGAYLLSASYTDRGNGQIGPITESATVALRNPKLKAVSYDDKKGIFNYKLPTGSDAAIGLADGSYMAYNDLDLTGISGISAMVFTDKAQTAGGKLEVRADAPDGPLLGEADAVTGTMGPVKIPFKTPANGVHKLYIVFVNPNAGGKPIMAVDALTMEPSGM